MCYNTSMEYREALRTLQAGQLPGQLWFEGPERYLTDDFIAKIRDRLQLAEDDLNLLSVEAKNVSKDRLFDFVLSPPLFADYKLLIIAQPDQLVLTPDEWDILCTADPSLIVCYIGHDSKLTNPLKKAVTRVNMKKINRGDMQKWLSKQFRLRGKRISLDQITRIIDRTRYFEYNSTTDLLFLLQEIEKLSATDEEIITGDRIDALLGRPLEDNVFQLLQFILDKDAHRTFLTLQEYLASGANLYLVIPLLTRNYYQLHILKKLQASGFPYAALGERAGIKQDFILRKMIASANRLSLGRIQQDLNLCLQYEKIYKSETVQMKDHLENLLLELMH